MKTKFLQVCIGLAIVLFSVGFFVRSFLPATAQTTTNQNTNNTGKYGMQLAMTVDSKWVLVWDTETGKSKGYYWSDNSKVWQPYAVMSLPDSPLGN